MFEYVGGDPANLIDPSGLLPTCDYDASGFVGGSSGASVAPMSSAGQSISLPAGHSGGGLHYGVLGGAGIAITPKRISPVEFSVMGYVEHEFEGSTFGGVLGEVGVEVPLFHVGGHVGGAINLVGSGNSFGLTGVAIGPASVGVGLDSSLAPFIYGGLDAGVGLVAFEGMIYAAGPPMRPVEFVATMIEVLLNTARPLGW